MRTHQLRHSTGVAYVPQPMKFGRRATYAPRSNHLQSSRRFRDKTEDDPDPILATVAARELFDSATLSQGLSVLLHLVALISFATMSGYGCRFLLLVPFWVGVVIGLVVYGVMLVVSLLIEEDDECCL